MASYHVTADWSRFVREDDPEARFVVAPADVERLGLGGALAEFLETPAPPKEYPKPKDKAARRPATK